MPKVMLEEVRNAKCATVEETEKAFLVFLQKTQVKPVRPNLELTTAEKRELYEIFAKMMPHSWESEPTAYINISTGIVAAKIDMDISQKLATVRTLVLNTRASKQIKRLGLQGLLRSLPDLTQTSQH